MRAIKLKNGERETVVRRFKIPGKNRGFLSICKSGNCYTTLGGTAWWVFDLAEYRAIDATSREAMLRVYNRERLFRDTEAFATFIIQSRKKAQ
jgi:hypothetical protein